VDVVGRVVAERRDVVPRHDVERLEQRGSLAPGTAGIDVDLAEARMHRRLDADLELGEILGGEEAALLALEADDGLGDVTAIEGIARRLQPGDAAARGAR